MQHRRRAIALRAEGIPAVGGVVVASTEAVVVAAAPEAAAGERIANRQTLKEGLSAPADSLLFVQTVPERRECIDAQCFSAGLRINSRMCQGGDYRCGSNTRCAEIVGQRLALLSEGFADKGEKAVFFKAEFLEARRKPPAEDGRVHVGRRRERFRRQREEILRWAVDLHGDGKQPVVA